MSVGVCVWMCGGWERGDRQSLVGGEEACVGVGGVWCLW